MKTRALRALASCIFFCASAVLASTPGGLPPDLHPGDVDLSVAQDGADPPDHARFVPVGKNENQSFRDNIDAVAVQQHHPQVLLSENRSGGGMLPLIRGDLRGNQVGIVAGGGLRAVDDGNASGFRHH